MPSKQNSVSRHGCQQKSESFTLDEILWSKTDAIEQSSLSLTTRPSSLDITDESFLFLLLLSIPTESTTIFLHHLTSTYSPLSAQKSCLRNGGLLSFPPSRPGLMCRHPLQHPRSSQKFSDKESQISQALENELPGTLSFKSLTTDTSSL